jgi:hypothetical protein
MAAGSLCLRINMFFLHTGIARATDKHVFFTYKNFFDGRSGFLTYHGL